MQQETDDAHITVYAKKKPQLNQPGNYVKINCGSCTKLINFDEESSISSCDSDVDYTLLDCTDSQNEMSQHSTLASGEGATKKDDSHTASSSKDKPKWETTCDIIFDYTILTR